MPAFVAMVTMPFTFSIGYGIIAGLLLWTLGMATAASNFLLFSWKIQSFTHTMTWKATTCGLFQSDFHFLVCLCVPD